MVQSGIIVPASAEQKKNFQEIGVKTFRDKFIKRLRETEKEYGKKFIPFDYACAKIDYEDAVERMEKEVARTTGFVDWDDDKLRKIDIGDLSKYAGEDRFKLIDEREVEETVVVGGQRVPTKTKMRFDYRCPRGHGVTTDIPWNKWQEILKEKSEKKVEKKSEKKEEKKSTKDAKTSKV